MAFSREKWPEVRLSDIDDMVRENVLTSSDGQKLVEYVRRKQGTTKPRLDQLFNGADSPMNFRFGHLERVTVQNPETNINLAAETSTVIPVSAAQDPVESGLANIHGVESSDRIPSIVTPLDGTMELPGHPLSTRSVSFARSPRVLQQKSPSRIPVQMSSAYADLNRKVLIKQLQRKNQLKCEMLRNQNMVSSTPKLDRLGKSKNKFMSAVETVSPIFVEHPLENAQARMIESIPSTQDQPDAVNDRERSPSREENEVIVPETPSPVRRSSARPTSIVSTSIARSLGSPMQRQQQKQTSSPSINNNVISTPKSILKNPFINVKQKGMVFDSPKRPCVSFSLDMCEVREIPSVHVMDNVSHGSNVTSDESSEEDEDEDDSRQRQAPHLDGNQRVSIGKRKVGSNPVLRQQEHGLRARSSTPSPERFLRRRSLSNDDIVHNGVRREEQKSEGSLRHVSCVPRCSSITDGIGARDKLQSKEQSKNLTNSNVSPMVVVDLHGSSSSDESSHDLIHPEVDKLTQHRTITSPMTITNIDTPRYVMTDIFEPPSAFCDKTAAMERSSEQMEVSNVSNNPRESNAAETSSKTLEPKTESLESAGKMEQNDPKQSANFVETMNEKDTSNDRADKTTVNSRRIISVSSPADHLPPRLIEAMDKFQTAHELANESKNLEEVRRRTVVLPTKRPHRTKTNAENESYFQAVQRPSTNQAIEKMSGQVRRKLYAREKDDVTYRGATDGDIPSPEPLPATQDDKNIELPKDDIVTVSTPVQDIVTSQPAVLAKKKLPQIRELAVVIERLSARLLHQYEARCRDVDERDTIALGRKDASEVPIPTAEKHNTEAQGAKETEREEKKTAENEAENGNVLTMNVPERKTRNQTIKKKNGQKSSKIQTSNEMRQQLESQGLRRSTRKRVLAHEVLMCNPNLKKSDAPWYVMPTEDEIIELYRKMNEREMKKKAKSSSDKTSKKRRSLSSKATKATKSRKKATIASDAEARTQDVGRKQATVTSDTDARIDVDGLTGEQKTVEEKKKTQDDDQRNQTAAIVASDVDARIEVDGFRIPAAPINMSEMQENNTMDTDIRLLAHNCESHDSGVSSAVTTNDEAIEAELIRPVRNIRHQQKQRLSSSSTVSSRIAAKASVDDDAHEKRTSVGATEDLRTAKRQAMDWMRMLMENPQEREQVLMTADIQGFTHCTLEHLEFERRGDIEYSFYIYSKLDNFGFVRLLPNAKKKQARLNNFNLKFLILHGALTFTINGKVVNPVGGDFLMLPKGSTYKIINGPEISLIFMMKTVTSATD